MGYNYDEDDRIDEEELVIGELRAHLRENLRDGTKCPVCDQNAREYKRKLNSGMAHALIVMYRVCGTGYGYKPDVLSGVGAAARDESLLRFWGLIEERHDKTPEGHVGWWRVTERGKSFVTGRAKVQKYVTVYNGKPTGFEGEYVDIEECLGEKFSLSELLTEK